MLLYNLRQILRKINLSDDIITAKLLQFFVKYFSKKIFFYFSKIFEKIFEKLLTFIFFLIY